MSFEESLIHNASPTLASIKVANLYNFKFESFEECKRTISYFNSIMNDKGIYIELLRRDEDFYLIYVYRKSHLKSDLQDREIKNFLVDMGYSKANNINEFLDVLKTKLCKSKDFPHEIGLFLGYPLADVKAFIEEKGQNCLVCGDWKAYHDEQYARCMFCKYKHCKEVYMRTYKKGRKLSEMLVSA